MKMSYDLSKKISSSESNFIRNESYQIWEEEWRVAECYNKDTTLIFHVCYNKRN